MKSEKALSCSGKGTKESALRADHGTAKPTACNQGTASCNTPRCTTPLENVPRAPILGRQSDREVPGDLRIPSPNDNKDGLVSILMSLAFLASSGLHQPETSVGMCDSCGLCGCCRQPDLLVRVNLRRSRLIYQNRPKTSTLLFSLAWCTLKKPVQETHAARSVTTMQEDRTRQER
ncbi:hypothetical protein B0T21DRAFT_343914 [Apiosordaria backusii]|uniref:Uncharacterized protein n=1 Tax=Apiosordaria backusii TaxID=314023 RepID=A0AA40K7H9_9PEZI|nr:hypothetical protein B0T21DRAFT_343914 [Apiosordaria backusii]